MTKRLYEWKLSDEIYSSSVHVYYGDFKTFIAKAKALYGIEEPQGTEPAGMAFCVDWPGEGYKPTVYLLWLPLRNKLRTPAEIATLSHEALHVTFFALLERGLKPKADNHEAFTYYQGWLLEQCLARMRKAA